MPQLGQFFKIQDLGAIAPEVELIIWGMIVLIADLGRGRGFLAAEGKVAGLGTEEVELERDRAHLVLDAVPARPFRRVAVHAGRVLQRLLHN